MIDISKSPATQIPAGLAVGGLLDLCSKRSQHGAEACHEETEWYE